MSAIFSFEGILFIFLMIICLSTYIHAYRPSLLDANKQGLRGLLWKSARIGERLSPWVSISCFILGIKILFFS